ncbi:unnamed protein product [Ascophyllum nodosum]
MDGQNMEKKATLTSFILNDKLTELIEAFPAVDFAFAYGSGVIQQQGYSKHVSSASELPMLDLVLAVKDSEAWHRSNLESRNSEHYSGVARLLGAGRVAQLQEGFGAKMYYNTLIPITSTPHRGRSMKYGVISTKHLTEDLRDWTWLYAAGRLQKPVRVIQASGEVSSAIQENLVSATKVALLLLPESFSAKELYKTIAGLSYTGDFRMYFGENPNKVRNIVASTLDRFQNLYDPAIQTIPGLVAKGHDCSSYDQDTSPSARMALARALPLALRGQLPTLIGKGGPSGGLENRWAPTAKDVSRALAAVVSRSSLRQGVKGLLTAGLLKSASYSFAKVSHAFYGRRVSSK